MKTRLRILMLNFAVIFIAGSSLDAPGEQVAILKINKEYDKRTVIKKSLVPNGGNGLFAVVKIKKGEVIGELGGAWLRTTTSRSAITTSHRYRNARGRNRIPTNISIAKLTAPT